MNSSCVLLLDVLGKPLQVFDSPQASASFESVLDVCRKLVKTADEEPAELMASWPVSIATRAYASFAQRALEDTARQVCLWNVTLSTCIDSGK